MVAVNLDSKGVERLGLGLGLLLVPVTGFAAYGLLVLVARTLKWLAG